MPLLLALSLFAADLSTNATFVAALDSYRQLEFEVALQKLEELRGAPQSEMAPNDRAVVEVWRGIVLSQLGEPEAAEAALRAAINADPAVVAPADAPPSVVRTLEQIRAEVVPEPEGPREEPDEPTPADRFEDPLFLTGVGLAGGGALLALTGAVGLVIVDAQVGAPIRYEDRVGLGNIGVGLLVTTLVGLGAAGAGAALLAMPAE